MTKEMATIKRMLNKLPPEKLAVAERKVLEVWKRTVGFRVIRGGKPERKRPRPSTAQD